MLEILVNRHSVKACFLRAVLIMPKKCFITGDSMGIPVTLFKCQITFPLI